MFFCALDHLVIFSFISFWCDSEEFTCELQFAAGKFTNYFDLCNNQLTLYDKLESLTDYYPSL